MLPVILFVTVKFVSVPTDVKLLLTIDEFNVVPVNVLASATDVIVISADPSNDMPLIFIAVASLEAVPALPSILTPYKVCILLDLFNNIGVVPT